MAWIFLYDSWDHSFDDCSVACFSNAHSGRRTDRKIPTLLIISEQQCLSQVVSGFWCVEICFCLLASLLASYARIDFVSFKLFENQFSFFKWFLTDVFFFFSFLFSFLKYLLICNGEGESEREWERGRAWMPSLSVLSFRHVGPGNRTQGIGLDNKCQESYDAYLSSIVTALASH